MTASRSGALGGTHAELDPDQVLTTAFVRAAELLGVPQKDQALVLGVSPATVSRYRKSRVLSVDSKEGELALIFLRLYRSLDALLGGERSACREWLYAYNDHLEATPAEIILTVTGLVHVTEYLDAMRGKI